MNHHDKKLAIGLMSGTSLDGIDAALVELQGYGEHTRYRLIQFWVEPFSSGIKEKISQAIDPKRSNIQIISELNFDLGFEFARAAQKVCKQAQIDLCEVSFIASHGQTVYHSAQPPKNTLQIGEPAVIAYQTNTMVISNFRPMDIAAGGEGAPLVPYSEFVLYRHLEGKTGLVNIGGISNITVLDDDFDRVIAFDTGPGNMIIDALVNRLYNQSYDDNGLWALQGNVYQPLLDDLMSHPFLQQSYPKSTGREEFGEAFVEDIFLNYNHLAGLDLIATATMFTAKSIAFAYQKLLQPKFSLQQMAIGGGGALNDTLVRWIRDQLPTVKVYTQEDLGFSSKAKEAIAFAILGNQTFYNQPSNVPSATGASRRVILGNITPKPWRTYEY